ncbi:uncharacterized protein LOC143817503 [Ranitomeya variabilis]|uniref:uncharacterized protein LOC143817503 n=1 Tax=Ranitomeya variabilis TaxID=490064 RepID=UPI004056CE00
MKDRFNKDLRAENRAASGSGARYRLYKYHRVLSFLRPVLLMRTTHSTTVAPGSGAVLQPAATDPSQPSSSAAAGGPSTLTGDQGAGPSGIPLSQSSFTAPIFAGSSRQRQRASDRSLMPEFLHLSLLLHEAIKALGDRMDVSHNVLNCRIQDVTKSLDQVKADLQRPAHHFFNQVQQGMSEHLSPDLQLSVMQACNVAFVQAMQQSQSRNLQQTVATYPTVPSLSRLTSIPTYAAYHCTATSIPSTGVLHYSANTMTSAVGHPTATTVTTAAPACTSSADTTMPQDPGVAFRPGPLPMQQDPDLIMRWSREAESIVFEDSPILIFKDLAASTLNKRCLLKPFTEALHPKQYQYRWLYPFGISITSKDKRMQARTSVEIQEPCEELGITLEKYPDLEAYHLTPSLNHLPQPAFWNLVQPTKALRTKHKTAKPQSSPLDDEHG